MKKSPEQEMLIYFSATNYRSINEKIELDLRANGRIRRLKHHLRQPTKDKKLKVLKSALMYGANASGKSNIIKAIAQAKQHIVYPLPAGRKIPTEPFKLNNDSKDKESSFCFEFVSNTQLFEYSFSLIKDKVINEKLIFNLDSKKSITLIEKSESQNGEISVKSEALDLIIHNGNEDEIEKAKELYTLLKYTAQNRLCLTELADKNYFDKFEALELFVIPAYQAFNFFDYQLITIFPESKYDGIFKELIEHNGYAYSNLLEKFDSSISSVREVKVAASIFFDEDELKELKNEMLDNEEHSINIIHNGERLHASLNKDEKIEIIKLKTLHKMENNNVREFDLEDESDGTKRLIDLLPALPCKLDNKESARKGITFIIDEFNRSLHPLLAKMYIEEFLSGDEDDYSQLIVSTHESYLLDSSMFRRDEIYFVQNERNDETTLYSLDDYSTRFDKDIHRAYLKGMYGAVPLIKDSQVG